MPPPGYPVTGYAPTPPPKKSLGTGAIVAIVIGAVTLSCCGLFGLVAVFSKDGTQATSPRNPDQQTTAAQATATGPVRTADPVVVAEPAPPPKAGPPTVKVGQPIDVTEGATVSTVTVSKVAKGTSDNQFTQPRNGQYVAVMVDVFGTKGATDLGPTNFRLIAADGTVYQAEILVVGMDPQLAAMTKVQEGQRKRGNVVFDVVPGSIDGFTVEVTNDYGKVSGNWTT